MKTTLTVGDFSTRGRRHICLDGRCVGATIHPCEVGASVLGDLTIVREDPDWGDPDSACFEARADDGTMISVMVWKSGHISA